MFAGDVIKTALSRLGYELVRKPNSYQLENVTSTGTAGLILEFIGPSGVGKSTLFRSVAGALQQRWFLPKHAGNLALANLDHDVELQEINRKLLLQRHLDLQNGGSDLWVCAGRMSYAARVAQMDVLMRGGIHKKFARGFALDEGACQVFAEQALKLDAADWTRFLRDRLLIALEVKDPEIVVGRAMARHVSWAKENRFKHPTNPERLHKQAERSVALYSSFTEKAESSGVRILRLAAEATQENNQFKILHFESSFA